MYLAECIDKVNANLFAGKIPDSIGLLIHLVALSIFTNNLTGAILTIHFAALISLMPISLP